MATFTADSSGSDMMLLFSWVDGNTPIDQINIDNPVGQAEVRDQPFGGGYFILYTATAPSNFTATGITPDGGTFTTAVIYVYQPSFYSPRGTLSGITNTDNFKDIDDEEAYSILDGDDTLNGGTAPDTLFGGYVGSDMYVGGGGGDTFMVAAGTTPQGIFGTNNPTDTITVLDNTQTGSSTLNLRSTTLSSIDKIVVNDGLVVQVNSSQIGATAGVSLSATILSAFGAGVLFIDMNTSALNLSGFTVTGGAEVAILGRGANEAITGTNGKDTLTPGLGNDTVNGLGGNDVFNVADTDSQFDAFNGGSGSDMIQVLGVATGLTLNAFNAASQSLETWDGNGKSLFGNANANVFNLAGLTGMTDLPFVEGLGGNDTLTGSKFVDHLLGGDGNDTMSAGAGNDELEGGFGVDTMTGGLGGDRFDFDDVKEIGKKKGLLDLITDWGDGDTIDLSSIDANGSKKGDKTWKFLKKEGAAFKKAGQVGFDQKKAVTYVQGDVNGDSKADFKLQVAGTVDFVKADFVL